MRCENISLVGMLRVVYVCPPILLQYSISNLGLEGWVGNVDRLILEARIQRERWVVGLWVRIATYHPRAAGQLLAGLQGRGGSTGLAVQGCGRDGTLLLFSVLLLLL